MSDIEFLPLSSDPDKWPGVCVCSLCGALVQEAGVGHHRRWHQPLDRPTRQLTYSAPAGVVADRRHRVMTDDLVTVARTWWAHWSDADVSWEDTDQATKDRYYAVAEEALSNLRAEDRKRLERVLRIHYVEGGKCSDFKEAVQMVADELALR